MSDNIPKNMENFKETVSRLVIEDAIGLILAGGDWHNLDSQFCFSNPNGHCPSCQDCEGRQDWELRTEVLGGKEIYWLEIGWKIIKQENTVL